MRDLSVRRGLEVAVDSSAVVYEMIWPHTRTSCCGDNRSLYIPSHEMERSLFHTKRYSARSV